MIKLNETENGREYIIKSMNAKNAPGRRLRDLGFIEGAVVKRLRASPLGDPCAYLIKGTQIAIRNSDAEHIEVEDINGTD